MRTFLAILVLLPAFALAAENPANTRVLKTFDFEERKLGNPEELPMHWRKVDGPNLPHYVNGKFATDRAKSGQFSFRFDLNGGSLIYRYGEKRIPVLAGAHYRIQTFCQTTVLKNARARVTAYFVDQDGVQLSGSVTHSELYAAKSEDEGWSPLNIELTANDSAAAFLVIELGLVQPIVYGVTTLGDRTIYPQDITGSAWFDDLTISQVPQVMLSTDRPGNIFRKEEPLKLFVKVSDRFTDDLGAKLSVKDARGQSVYQRTGELDRTVTESVGPGQKRLTILLPDFKPGWYQASLTMTSHGQYVGEQTIDFVKLADNAPDLRPDNRFGIIATKLPMSAWDELPELLPYLGAGRVKLAIWSSKSDIQSKDSASFDQLLERLGNCGIVPTACLTELPPAVASKVGGKNWSQIVNAKPEDWQPQLAMLIARHANHLDRWQLGEDGTEDFVTNPRMRQAYGLVYKAFADLVQSPDLAMPWPAWYEMEQHLPGTIAVSVPPSVLPSQLPLYVADLQSRSGHALAIHLQVLNREQYGRDTQIRDLAQRFVYALSAGATRIDLDLPFTAYGQGSDTIKQPQEVLMIERTLITTLAGATFKGKVPIAEGIEAFLFDRSGQGMLVLWDRGSESTNKKLAINLGPRATRLDLWGNATPLYSTQSADGTIQLEVGPMPTILLDIDGPLAQLRASAALDRPLLESSFVAHNRKIRFTNPWKTQLSGMLKLKAPAGWVINPPTHTFNLNPGETFERDIAIEFPYNSFAGTKTLDCEFQLQNEGSTRFTVPLQLTLGLTDVGTQTLALRDGNSLIVQQMITNYGDKPIDYTAFAIVPGEARQERLVTNLAPGKTTIKRYRFKAPRIDSTTKVRVGVKEMNGTRILNDEVPIQ